MERIRSDHLSKIEKSKQIAEDAKTVFAHTDERAFLRFTGVRSFVPQRIEVCKQILQSVVQLTLKRTIHCDPHTTKICVFHMNSSAIEDRHSLW